MNAGMGFQFVGYFARLEVNPKNDLGGCNGFRPYSAALASDRAVAMMLDSLGGPAFDHPLVKAVDIKVCEVLEQSAMDGRP